MFKTSLCDKLGIELPIIQAPIGSGTCPKLAAAVSNAGGLGMLSATWRTPDEIRTMLTETRALTSKPVGINLILENDVHEKLGVCLDAGIKIVSLFWGVPKPYIEQAHRAGAIVFHSVGSVAEARQAVDAGVDVIVAQGWEAGGHVRGTVSTLALVPVVVDAIAPVPVIAAGGIADGRGIAASFALGVSAVWIGTRFVASEEALNHRSYKEKLVAASVDDTVHSTLFDIGWENAPHRTLRNSTVEMWEAAGRPLSGKRPNEGEAIAQRADGKPIVRYSSASPLEEMQGNLEALAHYAGQSVGLVKDIKPASEIVRRLVAETDQAISKLK